jgi:ABC-type transporter MlaC component
MTTCRPARAAIRFSCLVAICLSALPARAGGQDKICQQDNKLAAVAYVLDLKDKADAILKKNKNPLASLKIQLLTNIEFDPLAKFALGRFWYKATTGQRVEYQGLFRKTVLHTLASHVLELRGARVDITRQYPIGSADILVKSRVFLLNGKAENID